ncbi:MAG: hypothetical protein JNK87_04660 [Bryobacterales bacterium]|nr:hypothetical protein [Bryobacterales bacterium]
MNNFICVVWMTAISATLPAAEADASRQGASVYQIEAKEDVSSRFPGAPRLHSFVWAEWEGKWLFLAGRIGGYHGVGGKEADFPRATANQRIWVVDPAGDGPARTYSLPVADLPAGLEAVKDQWMSANLQAAQDGETLYVAGGYGIDAKGKWVTYPILSAVHVPSLVKAVMGQGDLKAARIRYVESPHVQVTGGELLRLDDGLFYLVGGHVFMGSYLDFQGNSERNTGSSWQQYTSEIRKLRFVEGAGGKLDVKLLESYRDAEFRRRDLNATHVLLEGGSVLGAMAWGGVFTHDQGGFTKPLVWSAKQAPQVAQGFDQKMSAYSCARAVFFDGDTKRTLTTFFGGISATLWNAAKGMYEPAPRVGERSEARYMDGLQWIDRMTTVVRSEERMVELVERGEPMAGYVGTNAVFLPSPELRRVRPDAEIYDLRPLRGKRVLAGYLFGGIRAFPKQFPYHADSPDYQSGNVPTRASELILAVYLTVPAASE